jgi:hypothetical protein
MVPGARLSYLATKRPFMGLIGIVVYMPMDETVKFALILRASGIEVQPYLEYINIDIHEFLYSDSSLTVVFLVLLDSTLYRLVTG